VIEIGFDVLNKGVVSQLLRRMPDKFDDIVITSANKAISAYRSEVKSKTTKEWSVAKSQLSDFKITRANKRSGGIAALAQLRGKRIPLYEMGANPSSIMGGKTTGGVSVLIAGKRHRFKHAFVADINGKFGVYERKGSDRFPVKMLTTASVPQMVTSQNTKLMPQFVEKAQKVFNETIISECESWLNVMGGK